MTIGERIRVKRKEKGLTLEELALAIGYKSRSSVSKIESGERDIPQSIISNVAKALGTTPSYLMGWDDEDVQSQPKSSASENTETELDTAILNVFDFMDCSQRTMFENVMRKLMNADADQRQLFVRMMVAFDDLLPEQRELFVRLLESLTA